MGNREQKLFHTENRTHVTKREYSGAEISVDNSTSAPMDLRIFANSYQKVTEGSKNLFDIERYKVVYNPTFTIKDGKITITTTWTHHIYYEIKGLKPSTKYTLSLFSDKQAQMYYNDNQWFTASTKTAEGFYTCSQVIKSTSDGVITIYFRYGQDAQPITYSVWDIQLEEGEKKTSFEAFVPKSPSKEYPSEIYPLGELLLECSCGDKINSTKIPFVGYAMEVSDFEKSNFVFDGKYYVSDYIEYDSKKDKALRYKYIDDRLLDNTISLKDQTKAILKEPYVEELIPLNDEYMFSDVKSIQGGCKISTKSYSEDGLSKVNPLFLSANVKVIK